MMSSTTAIASSTSTIGEGAGRSEFRFPGHAPCEPRLGHRLLERRRSILEKPNVTLHRVG